MGNSLYRCGIYVRVSTEEQAENPEGSIKNQEQRLREFVKLKNLVAPFGEVTGAYSDPGFSAKDMNRPGFQNLLRAIERREINLVLVTEISRLTRSMKDFGLLQEFLRKNACEFLSLRENFDTSSATGGMVLNIMASIAEFERRQTAERISQSFLARAKRGLYNGGSVPLGYEVDPEKRGSLAIVPEEAELVRLIFETFLKRETMARTAKWLNEKKVELPRCVRSSGSRRAEIFRFEMIHKVLRNPAYAGIRAYRVKQGAGFTTEQTKANWEAIVSEDTFHRAQELLTKNRYRKRSHLNLRYPFTLSGVCYCQQCGHRMSGKSAHGKAGKIPYYEHAWERKQQAALTKMKITCEPARILAKKIEPSVWNDVKLFLTSETFIREVMDAARQVNPNQEQDTELKRIESKCTTLARQLEVLAERIAKLPESIDPRALYAQMENLQKSQKEAVAFRDEKRAQSGPQDQKVSLESLQAFTQGFRALLAQGDSNPELQAAIIRKLVHRVEIMKDGYEIFFHIGQDYYERERRNEDLPKTPLAAQDGARNEKRGLAIARPPSKPLDRFFLDSCSKRLESGGPSPANKNETASDFYITDFISFPVTPWYRDADYLRRKYLTEQLSTRQIADEVGSARATVARYLKGFKIPLRRHEDTLRLRKSSLAYGERLQDGKIVPCKRELQVIEMVKNLRAQRMSLQAIADFLNSTKIPTKSKKAIWKHQTVGNLLD